MTELFRPTHFTHQLKQTSCSPPPPAPRHTPWALREQLLLSPYHGDFCFSLPSSKWRMENRLEADESASLPRTWFVHTHALVLPTATSSDIQEYSVQLRVYRDTVRITSSIDHHVIIHSSSPWQVKFLCDFTKLRKATISFVKLVSFSLRIEQFTSH